MYDAGACTAKVHCFSSLKQKILLQAASRKPQAASCKYNTTHTLYATNKSLPWRIERGKKRACQGGCRECHTPWNGS